MKLIDEKGRLFGLINLIDFFVLLFLLAMIPVLYFGNKIIFRPVAEPFGEDFTEIRLGCQFIKLRPEVAKLISIGDREIDDKGRVKGEILELGEIESYLEETILRKRSATLKLKAQFKGANLYYKDKIIDYDTELVFKTDKYEIIAKVKEVINKNLAIRITLKELDENDINLIAVGDKEIDETGQIIAEIVKIGKPETNLVEVSLTDQNITIAKEVDKKQLAVELLLRGQIIIEKGKQQVYFKGKRIEYNIPIEFKTSKYEVNGLASKLYEILPERDFKWISLTAKFPHLMPEICNLLREGDIESDFYGVPLARIVKIMRNEPAALVAIESGKSVNLLLPDQRDLIIAMEIFCECKEDSFYFKNYPVKSGSSITFSTNLYSITGSVIEIEIR